LIVRGKSQMFEVMDRWSHRGEPKISHLLNKWKRPSRWKMLFFGKKLKK